MAQCDYTGFSSRCQAERTSRSDVSYRMNRPGQGRCTNGCTDVWAHVNTLRKRHSDCQVGLAGCFFGDLTCVELIYVLYNWFTVYFLTASIHF